MEDETQFIDEFKQKVRQWVFYILIFGLSLVVLIVFPMMGVGNDAPHFNFPTTVAGWIEFISIRLGVSAINVFIYVCFIQQGKLNVCDNENYKEANEILNKTKVKELKPMSPMKFQAKQYGSKSISIILGSSIALVAFPPIIAYDWKMALMYLLTISVSIVFGVYQMKVTEAYWSEEYLRWAKLKQEELNKEEEECSTSETKNLEI